MTAIDPRAGDVILFDDGATIRVDDVEAVASEAAKRGGVSWGRGDGAAATVEVTP